MPAVEVMLNSPLIADLIFKGEVHEIKEIMKRSRELGMQTFDQHLFDLYDSGVITYEDALRNADSVNDLRLAIKLHSTEAKNRNVSPAPRTDIVPEQPTSAVGRGSRTPTATLGRGRAVPRACRRDGRRTPCATLPAGAPDVSAMPSPTPTEIAAPGLARARRSPSPTAGCSSSLRASLRGSSLAVGRGGHGPGQETLQTGKRDVTIVKSSPGRPLITRSGPTSRTATTSASTRGSTARGSARSRRIVAALASTGWRRQGR